MRTPQKDFIFDANLELKDAGLVAADDAAQVSAADKIIDLGASRADLRAIIDVTATEVASNDELYLVGWQFSNSATFASGVVNGPALIFGALEVTNASADTSTGRFELPGANEVNGTVYRYARLFTHVTGTIATGINWSGFAVTA